LIPVTTFAGKQVAVFGLGKSGLLAAAALIKGGAQVVAFDDDEKSVAKAKTTGLNVRNLRELDWTNLAALVLAPGVPLTHPAPHWAAALARKANVEIIGDIELFSRERAKAAPHSPLVAITGTNGKSTTTALIAHLLQSAGRDAQMGGNIGVPVLALAPFAPGRIYVLEISSYQIDLAPSLHPSVGILINVSPDHLDRHGSLQNYAAIKERLVANANVSLVGVDDAVTDAIGRRLSERDGLDVIPVSAARQIPWGYFASGTRIVSKGRGQTLEEAEVLGDLEGITTLRGRHNAQNAAFACAAAWHCGLTPAEIARGLKTFPGLAHRMQPIAHLGNVLFVNDSKATNADSTAHALASFSDIFWIAGGKPKTGGIESLAEFFPRIAKAYLIGEAAKDFAKTLDGKVAYEIVETLDRAVPLAAREAAASGRPEPAVLLSPACASFDQYRNFEVRGEAFTDLVLALPGIQAAT
jgi:UDP-N-acetylmuramoylalanine--D-glutamate ligase